MRNHRPISAELISANGQRKTINKVKDEPRSSYRNAFFMKVIKDSRWSDI